MLFRPHLSYIRQAPSMPDNPEPINPEHPNPKNPINPKPLDCNPKP